MNERGFTREAIAANNKGTEKINGRNIYERALTSIAMCKFALKYYHEYCPNGKLPSGKTREDMLLYVRQKMFVQLKGAKSNKSNNSKKEECEKILTEDDMPDKWMFNGWFVLVLYGSPEAFAPTSLSCLSEDGKDVPKIGRAEARAKDAKVETEKCRADQGGQRGVSMQDQLTLATLSQAEFREKTKNIRELLALANAQETNTLNTLTLTCSMLEKADNDRERKYLRRRKLDLLGRLEELDERKKRLEEESDRLREDASNRKRVTLPEQVSVLSTPDEMNSSFTHSGSSSQSKKKKTLRSPELVVLMGDDTEDDEVEDAGCTDLHMLGQSFESPIPAAARPNKKKVSECPVEKQLNQQSLAVLNAYRTKQKENNGYGIDYEYDYV